MLSDLIPQAVLTKDFSYRSASVRNLSKEMASLVIARGYETLSPELAEHSLDAVAIAIAAIGGTVSHPAVQRGGMVGRMPRPRTLFRSIMR